MSVRARSRGDLVPPGFQGRVLAVYDRACTLALPGGAQVVLLTAGSSDLPHGIVTTARSFSGFRILADTPVQVRDRVLHVGTREAPRFAVDLRTARMRSSRLPPGSVDVGDPAVAAAWADGVRTLATEGPAGSLAGLLDSSAPSPDWATRAGAALAELVADLRAGAPVTATVGRLVGLGPGLTPGGDDALLGLLAGLRATLGDEPARHAGLAALADAVTGATPATSTTSQVQLAHGVAGHFPAAVLAVVAVVRRGTRRATVRATRAALAAGHTSGADTLVGLFTGLTAWSGPSLVTDATASRSGSACA